MPVVAITTTGWMPARDNPMEPISKIAGPISVLERNDVDTDQIIPKQFLKRVERTGFGEFLFYDWKHEDGWDLPANPILVTGRNFGCGSSREHAPWALEDYGFRAIVAPSFADIFYSNCTKIGLLPVVLPEPEVRALMRSSEAEISLPDQYVAFDGHNVLFDIDEGIKNRLLNGLDDIALALEREEDIERYERERERRGPVTTALVGVGQSPIT
jgi:3-isopropylmalate/(R)-2-methylmalate dehydratase small subunit